VTLDKVFILPKPWSPLCRKGQYIVMHPVSFTGDLRSKWGSDQPRTRCNYSKKCAKDRDHRRNLHKVSPDATGKLRGHWVHPILLGGAARPGLWTLRHSVIQKGGGGADSVPSSPAGAAETEQMGSNLSDPGNKQPVAQVIHLSITQSAWSRGHPHLANIWLIKQGRAHRGQHRCL
jgi:hypothetical protein